MQRLLDASGLPWWLEIGTRHNKLMVADRMITILPKSAHSVKRVGRKHLNTLAHIRRGLRELEQR
jgi:hypothetical protein